MTDFDRKSMLEMFILEMSQLIAKLESTILQSSAEYTSEQIKEIFRISHSVKGASEMMLYNNIADAAHAVENLFYFLRECKPQNIDYSRVSSHVLSSASFLKSELAKLKDKAPADGDSKPFVDTISQFLYELKGETSPVAATSEPVTPIAAAAITPQATAVASTNDGLHKYKAMIFFQNGCEMENIRAFTLVHNLNDLACDIVHTPENIINEESTDIIRENGFSLEFSSIHDYDYVNSHLSQTGYLERLSLNELSTMGAATTPASDPVPESIINTLGPAANLSIPAPAPLVQPMSESRPVVPPLVPSSPASSTDVERERAIAAEEASGRKSAQTSQRMIHVNVNKLDALANLVSDLVISEGMVTQNPELEGIRLDSFNAEARKLRKIISNLQQTVMSMRLVSLSAIFLKVHCLVRDMCRKLNKDVQLHIIGEDTEVDKNVIEHIANPIMHIIRESIDHGIEPPEERKSLGKDSKAKILLEAVTVGGDVIITIQDDGRGVGLDAVKPDLGSVGGSILVDSSPGEGTTFTLKIPQILAIIEAMSVSVAGTFYTIPVENIIKSFKAKPENFFKDPAGNEMVIEGRSIYNIVRLHEFFNISHAVTDADEGIIIMVEHDHQVICLLVDTVIGQHQAVLKHMPRYFKKVRGLSGCTLLGNGDISLVVDVPGFFDK